VYNLNESTRTSIYSPHTQRQTNYDSTGTVAHGHTPSASRPRMGMHAKHTTHATGHRRIRHAS
jgi:hypothetical protein